MDADASWDDDFDLEPSQTVLKVPIQLSQVSDTVRLETKAARALANVVDELHDRLVTISEWDATTEDAVKKGVALVRASLESSSSDDDPFFQCKAWKAFHKAPLELQGPRLEQVLRSAQETLSTLMQA